MRVVKKFLIATICVGLFISLMVLICTFETHNFNNGYCINCGAKYEAISRSRNGQTYYECPNCYYGTYY